MDKEKIIGSLNVGMSWLSRLLCWLTVPVRSNWVFLVVLVLLQGLCMWREWMYEADTEVHIWHFLYDLFMVCLLLQLIPERFRRFVKWILYACAYVLYSFEIFLMEQFQTIYTPTTINLWRETNAEESKEFLMAYCQGEAFWLTIGLVAVVMAIHAGVVLLQRKWGRSGRCLPSWLQPLVALLILVVFCMSVPTALHEKEKIVKFYTSAEQAEKIKWETFYSPVYRLAYSFHMVHLANLDLEDLRVNMRHLTVDSCDYCCPNIVLVIGESYSKHHSQLYGYKYATTPYMRRMQKEGSLVAMEDAITPWNLTSKVFKNMLSTYDMNAKGNWTKGVLFPALMRKAGYKVAFLTNQFQKAQNQNGVDFNGSFFLNDVELDSMCFDVRNEEGYAYDGDFIREYEKYEPSANNLIIFHLYGQHTKYDCRFDKKHAYFTTDSLKARKKLNKEQKQIVADYDNATRYNDEVFNSICNYFVDKDAIVIYLSDHGEEVYDYIWMFGRTPGDRIDSPIANYEFQIPMVMWFSEPFKEQHPDIVERVKDARQKPFISSNLSQLILGLAGVHTKWYSPKRDLLNEHYHPGPRLLKGSISYDSIIKGSRFDKNKVQKKTVKQK